MAVILRYLTESGSFGANCITEVEVRPVRLLSANLVFDNIHCESKNVDKCWPIFKIFSLLYFSQNLQQSSCLDAHHTLAVSLHYLAKLKI